MVNVIAEIAQLHFGILVSISQKFYNQIFAKILQSQTVIKEKLRKTLLYKKAARKLLVK
jgi:hypothetical protein